MNVVEENVSSKISKKIIAIVIEFNYLHKQEGFGLNSTPSITF